MKIKKAIKNFIRDLARNLLGRKNYIKIRFLFTHGYLCNLNTPRTWNEKIQYRKLSEDSEMFSKYVDKFVVRKYVESTIGTKHLIPLIAKFDTIDVSDFDRLPAAFVIKTSNGGGGENVKIVYDKTKVDLHKLAKEFNGYLSVKIGTKIDERFYDVESPCILIEKLMLNADGKLPFDYKCHIFNHNDGAKVFIQIDQGRFINHRRSIFSIDGMREPFSIQPKYESVEENLSFPEGFDKLIELSEKLASPFDYVRVDMYLIEGEVYFGELTFCHGSGWEPIRPKKYDMIFGKNWDLKN